ncbi:TM1812 family CRISPR-associated protein [Salmonella enterica subsp. enterica serovar Goldcoast]|nr:TM1812 family CRISPR-associated protein [Salmonella enterica subsp. enterica serovar Goldcoast]
MAFCTHGLRHLPVVAFSSLALLYSTLNP